MDDITTLTEIFSETITLRCRQNRVVSGHEPVDRGCAANKKKERELLRTILIGNATDKKGSHSDTQNTAQRRIPHSHRVVVQPSWYRTKWRQLFSCLLKPPFSLLRTLFALGNQIMHGDANNAHTHTHTLTHRKLSLLIPVSVS